MYEIALGIFQDIKYYSRDYNHHIIIVTASTHASWIKNSYIAVLNLTRLMFTFGR